MANYTSTYTGLQIDAAITNSNLTLPTISNITLDSTSNPFSASDLGITLFDDCQVIKAHNGLYYMFLDDFTGNVNNDVYCVSSASPLFTSPTYIGKVITRPLSRVGGIVHDSENEEYIMYITDRDTPREGVYAYSIPQADFPNGTWTNEGVVLPLGTADSHEGHIVDVMGNIIKDKPGLYTMYYSSFPSSLTGMREIFGNLAFSNNPKGVFNKYNGNPIYSESPSSISYNISETFGNYHPRAIIPMADGYLTFFEAYDADQVYWFIGAAFINKSFTVIQEIMGSPFFKAINQSFANPDSYYIDLINKKLYIYYQSTDISESYNFKNQHVAIFSLIP